MDHNAFEALLDQVVSVVNQELATKGVFSSSKDFEHRVREVINSFVAPIGDAGHVQSASACLSRYYRRRFWG
jgi:hypothetical protein